jgi:hypothetical protein
LNSFTPVLIIPWKLTSLYQKPNIIAISRWFRPVESQKAVGRRKKVEGRKQEAVNRGQKAEGRKQKAESRRQ